MSHDHPVDPYRNESQALLNMVRLFDVKGTARLYLTGYEQLGAERHLWKFDIYDAHYALLLDNFIADEAAELNAVKSRVGATEAWPIKVVGLDSYIAESASFDSLVLIEYKVAE